MIVYIAGPYRARDEAGVWQNIMAARDWAIVVIGRGDTPLTPHLNTMLMGGIVPDEKFLEMGLELLAKCDAILMTGNWENSAGSRAEFQAAARLGIPEYPL